ncbi:TIGR02594 family protein [Saprospira sp. CCB-QB6]|uniref:TIGR02594 family protein n=1 Tax=Saprospira sp. CCB-QB6 TaxID=3023936 RepID=UPI00234BDFC9|nr:TIGR02594 family protein [Saprospira sp. CCB-QB6]WCL80038.1 TIGR02594 family protein [Saprospira sp. CCB-QB6]
MANFDKIQARLDQYSATLDQLKQLFMSDGKIDAAEQKVIDDIEASMQRLGERIGSATAAATTAAEAATATTSEETNSTETAAPSASSISGSVGKGGANKAEDVKLVQEFLKQKGQNVAVDGDCGPKTIAAIKAFQQATFGWQDGRIDPGGKSWSALSGSASVTTASEASSSSENSSAADAAAEEEAAPTGEPVAIKDLQGSVGQGGKNNPDDVKVVQTLLREEFDYKVDISGTCDNKTITAISNFQATKLGVSKPDGRVDPGGKSWKGLNGEGLQEAAIPGPMNKPNWIKIAESELGVTEIPGAEDNPRVIEYHSTTGGFRDDETPWCASFVNWVMNKAGQGGTGSAAAMSWAKYGKKVDQPAYGAIAVLSYGGGKGHVGFVVGKKGSNVLLLGGNQSNMVKISAFGTSKIHAYVFPNNFEIPENYYTFGEAEGDFETTDFSQTR